jgi:hypothetical protein
VKPCPVGPRNCGQSAAHAEIPSQQLAKMQANVAFVTLCMERTLPDSPGARNGRISAKARPHVAWVEHSSGYLPNA